jgi:malate/lactate dehydrogenase
MSEPASSSATDTATVPASASALVPPPAVLDTMTRVILSQTEMSEEEVKTALERTNYDLKRVIREYMLGENSNNTKPITVNTSTNQLRFSEIRNFMDKSAEQYYRRQEMAKIYNQVLERKKAAAAAAAAEAASASASASTATCEEEVPSSNTHHEQTAIPESKL